MRRQRNSSVGCAETVFASDDGRVFWRKHGSIASCARIAAFQIVGREEKEKERERKKKKKKKKKKNSFYRFGSGFRE
jgi:hypothetical protein